MTILRHFGIQGSFVTFFGFEVFEFLIKTRVEAQEMQFCHLLVFLVKIQLLSGKGNCGQLVN